MSDESFCKFISDEAVDNLPQNIFDMLDKIKPSTSKPTKEEIDRLTESMVAMDKHDNTVMMPDTDKEQNIQELSNAWNAITKPCPEDVILSENGEVYRCAVADYVDDERMIVESDETHFNFHVVDCEGTKSLICLLPNDCERLYAQLAKHIEAMK